MTIELTNEEKIGVVEQHLKSLAFNEYNLVLSIEEAQAASAPNQTNISALNLQLDDIRAQKAALQSELANLSKDN
jgi:hypothetical protein